LVSLSKCMSQTCSAMTVRESTLLASRQQGEEGELFGVRSSR
jgi:hypothetical protein